MNIDIAITFAKVLPIGLVCLLLVAIADSGLTGAMRRLALWLLVAARSIDERHAERQKEWRMGIVAEGGAL